MPIDPRSPVLVGAGQILQKIAPDAADRGARGQASGLEPIELMERAARSAADDAGCPAILSQLDSVRVPRGLWPYSNPAWRLAERLGSIAAQTAIAQISGNMVQRMLSDAAREIAAGRRDAVLVVGAEAEHSKRRAKRTGHELHWHDVESPEPELEFGEKGHWILPEEVEAGIAQPAAMFTLYENARRHAAGESLQANRDRIARLWHGFARVAERNPYAWTRQAPSVEVIREATPDNKMNAWPYTKRLCANLVVDQGAALILCSAERAQRLGIARDRWVFLHTATDCQATPQLSHRADFLRVPALELAGRRALELSGVSADAFEHVELYSCFPAAVQIAAEALGFSLARPLTVTGGLAYAGGPFNSYVLHAIATTMVRLRGDPGSLALVSSVGGSFAKHAFGIYSTEPSEAGFQYADLDAEASGLPQRELASRHDGEAVVETYSLRYRDDAPAVASFACLLDDGRRTWAKSEDPELFEQMLATETCGRPARLKGRELVSL